VLEANEVPPPGLLEATRRGRRRVHHLRAA
jgi:hypothetical protein